MVNIKRIKIGKTYLYYKKSDTFVEMTQKDYFSMIILSILCAFFSAVVILILFSKIGFVDALDRVIEYIFDLF